MTLPLMQEWLGAGSWQAGWAALAVVSVALGSALFVARGAERPRSRGAARADLRPMTALLAGYLVSAAGSITYLTFMITWISGHGTPRAGTAEFWIVLGLAAMAAPWLWGGRFRRLPGGAPLAVTMLTCFIGSLIPLATAALPALILSGAIFGSAFFASVAATTLFVKRNLAPHQWPTGIAAATVAFGLGQTIGPILTGAIADRAGGLGAGLAAGTLLMFAGAVIASRQRDFGAAPQA